MRLLFATSVGAALGLVLALLTLLLASGTVCTPEGFACLGLAMVLLPVTLVVGTVLSALALRRDGHPWPTALLGVAIGAAVLALGRALDTVAWQPGTPVLLVLAGALGYLAAAALVRAVSGRARGSG
ncbi:hypothetical protein JOF53_004102 [Crossiella equi]|uniref:Uncharacterized protein n=1 Tax=Crossiella equi TaxID=130796 RepID=A0ABS5AF67_9PSEU|nr:hypothetical protein [Crossiella equi]MBP2475230.1 hypothetical protein [Crossiella equi]